MTRWRILLAFFVLLLEAFWQRGSVKCPLQVPPCLMSLSDSFFANLKVFRDGGAALVILFWWTGPWSMVRYATVAIVDLIRVTVTP